MSRYSREEIKKWKEVFKAADVDNNHFITTDELIITAKEQGIEMNDEQAAEFIKNFDNNGNGKIEFSEFLKVLGERGT
ncbi:EF-hand [Penicillium canescens]|uniref:EF-hand n=1 Tax=Penicillium canescens TaxID=5083 RepID=A0AAD6IEI3_PENCN|nr:EF-hand [Penicillium canescens]KAJ5996720.1 EF-hand [Penicillium canescens]KAJ6044460.1 EF-hand [Penicillium canescens]KAJ6055930.1 EF-hand [Penicillium canescens]KAJ6074877.1 EF-hand [Penicillium canescens]KAJ6082086.1 EF-hand [Penicillium canescens]